MSFDAKGDQPLIQPRRWATKVNFALATGVVLFLILGFLGIFRMRWRHNHPPDGTQQTMEDKR